MHEKQPTLCSPSEVITMLNRTAKHEHKEQGKTQHKTPRSKNQKATPNKNHTRTTALEWSVQLYFDCRQIFILGPLLLKMKENLYFD